MGREREREREREERGTKKKETIILDMNDDNAKHYYLDRYNFLLKNPRPQSGYCGRDTAREMR